VELLRSLGPLLLAAIAALLVDRSMARRGMLPPRFAPAPPPPPGADPTLDPPVLAAPPAPDARARRLLGLLVVAAILWVGAFAPLASIGEPPPDLSELTIPRLFTLHLLLVAALTAWYVLGYLPRDHGPPGTAPRRGDADVLAAYGLRAASVGRELLIGVGVGLGFWLLVLALLLLLAGLVALLGGREALPEQPPSVVLWIGALPVWARIAIALSAGVVEETFFRGFLQPRVGVALSTVLFALAHLSYGQPFLLVGITVLSLLYAQLARRRGGIWAPIAAHAVFDLVQLLVVVPLVARTLERDTLPELIAELAGALLGLR
jgi:membrane protease YdiL (CAAX protease family)